MTRYGRIAARALKERLAEKSEPVMLFSVSCMADEAARKAGKRRDLHESLEDYIKLLPEGWRADWLAVSGGGDSLLYAIPPGWEPGMSRSKSLLLGGGPLIYG